VDLNPKGGETDMGRTLENKKEIVAELQELLSDSQLAMVIDYKGLSVAEITDLRNRLREKGAICKVTKNTLMRIAVENDENWKPMTQFLKDSSAFLLVQEDLGGAIKAYKAFQKDTKKTELRGGVMEGRALSTADTGSHHRTANEGRVDCPHRWCHQCRSDQAGSGYQCGTEEIGRGHQRSSIFAGACRQSRIRKRPRGGVVGLGLTCPIVS
jgi:ribosomal protein L10